MKCNMCWIFMLIYSSNAASSRAKYSWKLFGSNQGLISLGEFYIPWKVTIKWDHMINYIFMYIKWDHMIKHVHNYVHIQWALEPLRPGCVCDFGFLASFDQASNATS